MSLTIKEKVDILPLFIRRDLGPLSEKIRQTRNLSGPVKIKVLSAILRFSSDPDDPGAVKTVLDELGI